MDKETFDRLCADPEYLKACAELHEQWHFYNWYMTEEEYLWYKKQKEINLLNETTNGNSRIQTS